jgi:GntR family transcriptional regulator/MocR family aminotransferase
MLELAFSPDRAAPTAIYRQLADYLRELISAGRLEAGEKLPATRELAASLRIGRNTANLAYQTLLDEGVLVAHVGQGTFVSSRSAARIPRAAPQPLRRAFAWEGLLSRSARAPIPDGLRPPRIPQIAFDFRGGRVDEAGLPTAELKRAYARAIGEGLSSIANDLHPLGYGPLREQIARLLVGRGIRCEPGEIVITSGAQQALDLVTRVLIDPGDAVAVEQPGYFGATLSFRAAGAELVGIEVDADGLRTDVLARALRSRRIKLIYTTPSAQMPTGVTLSDARRSALLDLADETQTPVLEDDYDSEFRHDTPALAALKTRDSAGQVIYVGTFSKAFFPGLRVGYAVAARPLLARLAVARSVSSFGGDALAQAAVSELLASGALERHVRRLRKRYAERLRALLDALAEHMPDGTRWTEPSGGLTVWLRLPDDADPHAVHTAAAAAGVAYAQGQGFFSDGRGAECLALSFANIDPAGIAAGVARLAQIIAEQRFARRSA